ncbi:MAG: FAD-dependent oxidoreductase [Rhodothermales bacterium]|nr:FAD-dependent oxidoreductase [Rhodothermales bacterium]
MAAGSPDQPFRVAIVGAGPSGFYAAAHLLKNPSVEVDLFDRLPTPYGLVRGGVAPDHQKIKTVVRQYDKTAQDPRFRFFGNVELGRHLSVEDLHQFYHLICYTTGAQTDRTLGIPGEALAGSHSATEFVAWYNGHPDFRDLSFDLSQERVAVVGVGNVAVDVARILCRTPEELARTDMADYALEALRHSKVREVVMLGRRGPAQAAFTNPEIKELGEMEDADAITLPAEVALDPLSQAMLERNPDRAIDRKIEILQEMAVERPLTRAKKLIIRFLVSPTEIVGDEHGTVRALRLEKNSLSDDGRGGVRPVGTGVIEEMPVGLIFRSVGYLGVPLPGIPFNARAGLINNTNSRVVDPTSGQPVTGEYVAGWIKRGPSGVIGTNKACAVDTVDRMMEDAARGEHLHPAHSTAAEAEAFVRSRQSEVFTYADWLKLDALETAAGEALGRPRVKFTRIDDMVAAVLR